MNIEQLQYLCMVAKTGSITLAADNLFVTQQTISKAINKLEQELGVILLIRSHRGVQLTDVGKTFVGQADQIVKAFQDLYDSTHINANSHFKGTVRLMQNGYVGHILGAKFLTKLKKIYPELHVYLEEAMTFKMIDNLLQGSQEIAIVPAVNRNFGTGRLEDYGNTLEYELLFRDTLVACVAKNSPLAKKESISLKELSRYPVAWGECGHMKEIISDEYNIQLDVILDSTNMSMHKELIMDRTAFGFATELIIHGASYDSSGYKVIPIKENVKLETYLTKRKDVNLTKAQQIVVDELRSAIKLL